MLFSLCFFSGIDNTSRTKVKNTVCLAMKTRPQRSTEKKEMNSRIETSEDKMSKIHDSFLVLSPSSSSAITTSSFVHSTGKCLSSCQYLFRL